jgi:hypothetical protein
MALRPNSFSKLAIWEGSAIGMVRICKNDEQSKNAPNVKVDPETEALKARFFDRDAVIVARELIGCYLVRRNNRLLKHRITEVEAYVGPHDLACHSSRGRTKRNETMFGPPETLYVILFTAGIGC